MMKSKYLYAILFSVLSLIVHAEEAFDQQTISFKNTNLELKGILYKPKGTGPFPAVIYNHGSAPGMLNEEASKLLGPLYAKHGWIFFMPYRRGQGLSENAGPYIMDEVKVAQKNGTKAASQKLLTLLTTDHLSDQLSGLKWLKEYPLVDKNRVATAGNSFGGVLTILSATIEKYCAAIDVSGASQSWTDSPEIQALMIESAKRSKCPIFFFQAENDYDLSPSKVLSEVMKKNDLTANMKIFPKFGDTAQDGHSFAYRGSDLWEKDVFNFLDKHCGKHTSN